MSEKPIPKLVTPYKYAQLCGVSTAAIYQRISREVLEVVEKEAPDGSMKQYIDTLKFPPSRLIDYPEETQQHKKKEK